MNLPAELVRVQDLCARINTLAKRAKRHIHQQDALTDMAATTQKLHELALALVQVTGE